MCVCTHLLVDISRESSFDACLWPIQGSAIGDCGADVEHAKGPPDAATNLHLQRGYVALLKLLVQAEADAHAQGDAAVVVARVGLVALLQVRGRQAKGLDEREVARLEVARKEAPLGGLEYGQVRGVCAVAAGKRAQGGHDVGQRVPALPVGAGQESCVLGAKGGLVDDGEGWVVEGEEGVYEVLDGDTRQHRLRAVPVRVLVGFLLEEGLEMVLLSLLSLPLSLPLSLVVLVLLLLLLTNLISGGCRPATDAAIEAAGLPAARREDLTEEGCSRDGAEVAPACADGEGGHAVHDGLGG